MRKSEVEAGVEETAGDDLAALQNEFGFGAHEEGADLDHPRGCGKTDASAPGFAYRTEKVAIGERVGGDDVDDAGEVLCGDDEFDRADEIDFVDPGDKLIAGAVGAAEAVADEREEDVEDSAGVGAEVMALRRATLRVRGVRVEKKASSQALATWMEKFQVSGAPGSLPPSSPVASSMGRSREWR
jgi:hypothetical protein